MHQDWRVDLLFSLLRLLPYLAVIVPVLLVAGVVWLVRRKRASRQGETK